MANKKIWLGILVMVLVFGMMTVVGCDNGSTSNSDDTIPKELVGEWYLKGDANKTVIFEITSAGEFNMQGHSTDATVTVSGKKVSVHNHDKVGGTFEYSIANGEMTVTNGYDDCEDLDGIYLKKGKDTGSTVVSGTTWKFMLFTLSFDDTTYQAKMENEILDSGTYTVSGDIIYCDGNDEDFAAIKILDENNIEDLKGSVWTKVN